MSDRNPASPRTDQSKDNRGGAPAIQGGETGRNSTAEGVRQPMVAPGGPLSGGGADGGAAGQPEDASREGGMIGEG